MARHCIIVESPSKAKTIGKYLGKDYRILATVGHIRDLPKKDLGIDTAHRFEPKYVAVPGKKDVIMNLKKAVQDAKDIFIATDPDREGEAIAWHVAQILDLDPSAVKRVAFHEITKNAVLEALAHPVPVNLELVNAQQARRVLDRLVGFELSPLLWRKIKPSLSAGRVQSVAVRLIVEREAEIESFAAESAYRVAARFLPADAEGKTEINAELPKRFKEENKAEAFLESCRTAAFLVDDVEKNKAKKQAPPPFTTSTLQQEAGRKLRFSVSQTMMLAQKLYEDGHITYMRTDSLNLSSLALAMIKAQIVEMFGEAYSHPRKFKTRSKGAQEAHEAIRPTDMHLSEAGDNKNVRSLYRLIWKRSMASQMAAADVERTKVRIRNDKNTELLEAKGEVVTFPGFLKVYQQDEDKENLLPALKKEDKLTLIEMEAVEKFSQPPARYSEPALVKKMEELGIGRPSTYAPTISTIQKRGYVEKGDKAGEAREYRRLLLKDGRISAETLSEVANAAKARLYPTDTGRVVNRFLTEYFEDIINYNFTAGIEQDFDDIAEGKREWHAMIREFYDPFHARIEQNFDNKTNFRGERLLGTDPVSGKNVYAKIGRFGPIVQLGEVQSKEKPRFAGLKDDQRLDTLTLKEALELLAYPKEIGNYEGSPLTVAVGRYGPYIKHKSTFYPIPANQDIAAVDLEHAIALIGTAREKESNKLIRDFPEEKIKVLNGRYGPYIAHAGKNYRIPKNTDAEKLTADNCREIIRQAPEKDHKRSSARRKKK
ncbi:MAG: type I DNA topoisomerase [Candidatus Neomarinimicrobiota bacterium]|nr:type I DNA topoisomerase [Candidatus Neomarinimicrobiota bacterium]